ncbi:MAG: hypothetical protein GY830_08635 [Bacteroidetes bacterium]|nr:hypothetical protein [Bacteroidota bacterium]
MSKIKIGPFVLVVLILATILIPSYRQIGRYIFNSNYQYKTMSKKYFHAQYINDKNDILNLKRYLSSLIHDNDQTIEKVINEYLQNKSLNLEVVKIISKYYERNMRFEKAFTVWSEILEMEPKEEEILKKIEHYLITNNKEKELVYFYEKKLQNDRGIKNYLDLIILYFKIKDKDKAKETVYKLREEYPESEKEIKPWLNYVNEIL